MAIKRRKTKVIKIGRQKIGGSNPVRVQSMANTDTGNVTATVKQIQELQQAGCEIVRVAVLNMAAAKNLGQIKRRIQIPLVADIHFDYKLALEAINQGIDKIRINPGNIGSEDKIKMVVEAAKKKKIPIRIGVNTGSIEKKILKKYKNQVTPAAMVESALYHVKLLEKFNFKDIVISLKASDVNRTITAYRLMSKRVDYPLHLGVTEAGTKWLGTIKSAIGIGSLLNQGIGDTIRVSLTDNPVEEVKVAWEILKDLNLRQRGRMLISCPTCGRTQIDLIPLAKKVEKATADITKPITIAVMGCIVNGPGEAREADLG
ncbi:flavodoxin-dependent (E)-4-hydroxy-3-methylbut-2-enyl-diphosphate synthase, partial [Patescibacteria group bacterium]|nr:flavodoxin-dependent (E)-4-hydroxy-3-methylbut-2-enyl-diphosphate synthase [Patescibacteria group bacterium]